MLPGSERMHIALWCPNCSAEWELSSPISILLSTGSGVFSLESERKGHYLLRVCIIGVYASPYPVELRLEHRVCCCCTGATTRICTPHPIPLTSSGLVVVISSLEAGFIHSHSHSRGRPFSSHTASVHPIFSSWCDTY